MEDKIEDAIRFVERKGARYVDVRIEERRETYIDLRDDTTKISYGIDGGIGARVLYGNAWGFASTNDLSMISNTVEEALKIAKTCNERSKLEDVGLVPVEVIEEEVKIEANPNDVDIEDKMSIVEDVYQTAKGYSSRIKSVVVTYVDGYTKKIFSNSDGTYITSEIPAVYLNTRVISKRGTIVQEGTDRIGAVAGFEFIEEKDPYTVGLRAADKAIRLLEAEFPPAGRYPLVMDNELVGVFVHEALGHAAEADHVIAGESILKKKIGEKIASDILTVSDDPSLRNAYGHYVYDDEGVPGRRTSIIKDGILMTYLHSRETAEKLNSEPTGNARAESYAKNPIVRMSNIIIELQNWSFREMIEGIDFGIYAKGMRGGEVDTISGEFQFTAEEGFLIEKGDLSRRLKNVSISGMTLNVLKRIDAVGKDFKPGSIGHCGKEDQLIPVSEYAPHVRVEEILIGGSSV
jgi:TldD protein